MKIGIILLFCYLLSTPLVSAQQTLQNQNWVFGKNVRIEFNSNSVTPQSTNFSSIEACAVVSNPSTGELMFYSNGEVVMDKNGDMLQNGDNLNGSVTSSQGALILPHPNNMDQYLLFTTPAFTKNNSGLYYSVIDMSLNNGLGAVVPNQKNILLYKDVTEGMTYTFNTDSSSYWLLAHERLTDAFLCFEISKNGIGTNLVKSNIGRNWTFSNFLSYIKISPDGKRIAVSNTSDYSQPDGKVELYSFDNCTGSISNLIKITNLPFACYGNAFSENSNVLYISSIEFPSRIYQVDLSAGNEPDINASLAVVFTAPPAPPAQNRSYYMAGMQLNEDNKIYITESTQGFLHCIENPNALGINCNFAAEKVKLVGGTNSYYSLPQLVPVKLKNPKIIKDSILISIQDTCVEYIKNASLIGLKNATEIQWKLIDLSKNDSMIVNDSTNFNLSNLALGEYLLSVVLRQDCKNYSSSLKFTVVDCECSGFIGISDTCLDQSLRLNIVSEDPIFSIDWLLTRNNGDTITSQISRALEFKVDSAQSLKVRAIVKFSCRTDTLTAIYQIVDCPDCSNLFIPNSFSPNNDGVNDRFSISSNCDLESYNLTIYNRWGELIYQNSHVDNTWDGTYKNVICPEGIYLYNISYKFRGDESTLFYSGAITLLK